MIDKNNGLKPLFIVRYNEIALKGKNRGFFEEMLANDIRSRFAAQLIDCSVRKTRGRIYIYSSAPDEKTSSLLETIPGIASYSQGYELEKQTDFFKQASQAVRLLTAPFENFSFKIEARREDKTFPFDSMQLCRDFGGFLLEIFPAARVDVHNPEKFIELEIRDCIYISIGKTRACGGLPGGSTGKIMLLLSGGIDSPVAGKMLAVRGISLYALHFSSYPFTSRESEEKVISLARALSRFSPNLRLFISNILPVQKQIRACCEEKYHTVILRRCMMKIACLTAVQNEIPALATGESIGQVASQTLESISCSNAASSLPVLRPCIALNKDEIIDQAKKIGTFNLSIIPHDDCCTLFSPPNPSTKPRLQDIINNEKMIPELDLLLDQCHKTVREEILLSPETAQSV
ncbi:MAG TPA: tRNA 4-thiouridine(8) synthase ThiI [Spirochaetia bacterium]|nr:tRNA 4-thiouridine(8) synthase ThiI [Spirochaetia bacterium]